jgi:hypothetical protein
MAVDDFFFGTFDYLWGLLAVRCRQRTRRVFLLWTDQTGMIGL